MQKTLDQYGAGVVVQQVQMQKVDPPQQVIDSFRDVQAARADLERAQNEAQTYANRVVPEARGRAAQILQAADAYKSQTVAEAIRPDLALHQDLRRIQEGAGRHAQAHVSRDHGARDGRHRQDHPRFRRAVRIGRRCALPAAERTHAATAAATTSRRAEVRDETGYRRRHRPRPDRRRASCSAGSSLFTVYQTQQAIVVRLGEPVRVVTEPGLNFKCR